MGQPRRTDAQVARRDTPMRDHHNYSNVNVAGIVRHVSDPNIRPYLTIYFML